MAIQEIITWHKSYTVHVPLIDAEHMELIDLINKLYRSCFNEMDSSIDDFMDVLHGAVGYIKYHFSTEEKIMERVGYSGFDAHKKQHTDFVKEVLNTVNDLKNGVHNNPLNLVKYFKDWLLTHIGASDTELGKHLVDLKHDGTLDHCTLKVKTVDGRYVIG